jgi:transcription antitermination factor NusG
MQNTWFALQTRHQHEAKVTQILENKGFETFLPMYQTVRRWSDRKKTISLPLFPGYVFISQIAERQFEVLNTSGVATIVSFAGVPASISTEEIDSIRRATSNSAKVEPYPYLQAGDEICVRSGPLAGTSGFLIRKKDCYRLVVCVEILGRAASVEIDAFDLDPATVSAAWSETRVS